MWSIVVSLLLIAPLTIFATDVTNQARESRDSYLDAYKESQGFGSATKPQPFKSAPVFVKPVKVYPQSSSQVYVTPEPSKYGTPDATYGIPDAKYPENHKYSPPDNKYLPNPPTDIKYGTPSTSYGTPVKPEKFSGPPDKYGPPSDKYGPPVKYETNSKEVPWYGVPHFHHHYTMQPSEPITDPEPVDQGHGGFDLKTVFKFIAKIFVLKAIVKFVYIVMYLLFMPKLSLLSMLSSTFTEKDKPDSAESVEKPEVDIDDDDLEQLDEDDGLGLGGLFRKSKVSSIPKSKLDELTQQISKAISTPPS